MGAPVLIPVFKVADPVVGDGELLCVHRSGLFQRVGTFDQLIMLVHLDFELFDSLCLQRVALIHLGEHLIMLRARLDHGDSDRGGGCRCSRDRSRNDRYPFSAHG